MESYPFFFTTEDMVQRVEIEHVEMCSNEGS